MITKLFFDTPKSCVKIMVESPQKYYFAEIFKHTKEHLQIGPHPKKTHDKFLD